MRADSGDDYTSENGSGVHHHHWSVMVEPFSQVETDTFENIMGSRTTVLVIRGPADSERGIQCVYFADREALERTTAALLLLLTELDS